ncbi:uncharacterized protein LOC110185185 [Drosophila serrata]|uniref:uncharacterized protein LOC110185185 n=1 Tax=Drosophila serrata TaxID=7274 RepID=UPI000A1CF87E|nr:uncharacterized protein LOC110185185 [Drosophila serrata]
MHYISAVTNLLLIAACVYAFYTLAPAENPYGYLAASFSLAHGLLGLVRAYYEEEDECGRAFIFSASILEVIPLPLANIEFYLISDHSAMALVHALSFIPLFYDVLGKMGDEWDSSTEALKDMALLANIASASYLGFNDDNLFYYAVAGLAFLARYGAILFEYLMEGAGAHLATLGSAGIVGLMAYTLTN